VEVSALNGDNVEELFNRLARMILTKIELGEIDPDDPASGIQYGDLGWDDGGSMKSGLGEEDWCIGRLAGSLYTQWQPTARWMLLSDVQLS
jgi:Ras-related protein Rab-4B